MSERDAPNPLRPRPCLVCQKPCRTEGQLCGACVDAGHRVTDDAVIVQIEVRLPGGLGGDE